MPPARRTEPPEEPGRDARAGGDRASPARLAWAAALRALARRPRSAREIEELLRKRFGDDAVVAATMARLAEARLLDDRAVADAVMRDAARRGVGSRRVRRVLARRGVAAEAAPASRESELHDLEAARELVARRFPAGPPTDPRDRARALRLLAARGFPATVARRLLGIDRFVDDDPAEGEIDG